MSGLAFGMAYLLDLVVGDPQGWPHPVRLIGKLVAWLDESARRIFHRPSTLKLAGLAMVLIVAALTWLTAWGLIKAAGLLLPGLDTALTVVLAYTTLATRSLYDETRRVTLALHENDLPRARQLLSMVVGRETKELDRRSILRALLETVAENLSDGVVGPMFFLALGGPPLALAYKAVSTMDSMIGYKNEKYLHLGWAAARTDDLLNLIPARLTAALIAASALILGLDSEGAVRIWFRDGGRHSSPNAGRPEAALAGALAVRLGGPSVYHGRLVEKPFIGDDIQAIEERHLNQTWQVLFISSGLLCFILLLMLGK